jgi:hypothetical protein
MWARATFSAARENAPGGESFGLGFARSKFRIKFSKKARFANAIRAFCFWVARQKCWLAVGRDQLLLEGRANWSEGAVAAFEKSGVGREFAGADVCCCF